MPVLTVVGGPNGSGKSSVICTLHFKGHENLLNPDVVAKRMNPDDPQRAAVAAAREVKRARISTIAKVSPSKQPFQVAARSPRCNKLRLVDLPYGSCTSALTLPSATFNDVRERVARGGHDVPEADVRRRYHRSLSNLPAALRLAHEAVVYDNSDEPRKVLETQSGAIVWRAHNEPAWVTRVCEAISSPDTSSL